jgi:hypothetical protein
MRSLHQALSWLSYGSCNGKLGPQSFFVFAAPRPSVFFVLYLDKTGD